MKVKLGRSELLVPRICFGMWQAGGVGWGRVKDIEIIEAIQFAIENKFNFFDTADIYGFGHSEEVLGFAIKNFRREEIIIATKVGFKWDENKVVTGDLTPQYIKDEVKKSLDRLKTYYIDLYQAHYDTGDDIFKMAEAFEELVEKKYIRYWGVSNFHLDKIKKLIKYPHFVSIQPEFSLLEMSILRDGTLKWCIENNIAVIPYSPLAKGILTGKYEEPPKFEGFDWRTNDENFKEPKFSKIKNAIKSLKFSPISVALNWLVYKGVTAPIVGFKNKKQVEETINAIKNPPPYEELIKAENIFSNI
ncbi:MAG: aldo/keto reductase [bacterium]|nr:aldo/keto reductase [bacterium]